MTCRNCGGKLQIIKDADQVLCQHCRTEYLVFHNGDTISIKLLDENIDPCTSSNAASLEMALERLRNEIIAIWLSSYNIKLNVVAGSDIRLYAPSNHEELDWSDATRAPQSYNPGILLLLLESTLQREKNKIFRNKKRIRLLEKHICECKSYVSRLKEIKDLQSSLLQSLERAKTD